MVNCFKTVKNNSQIKSSSHGRIQEFTWDFVNLHFVNLHFVNLTFGQFTFGQFTFRQLTFRQLAFRQFTFGQFTVRQFTFGQLTFCQFTFRQPYIWSITTFGELLPNVNRYIYPLHWSTETKKKIKNLVNFDLQGVYIYTYIFKYRIWNNCTNKTDS